MVGAGPPTAPRRAAILAAAVALAATGCSALKAAEPDVVAQQPGTVTRAPSGLTPGPYALTTEEGAVISFELPTVPAPDDEVEALRRELNVEAVTYVELHIDNTRGTRAVQIEDLKVISHEGGQFPFEPAAEVLADWDPHGFTEGGFWTADGTRLEPGAGAALDARTHALIAHYTGAVPAGAQGHELMIGDFEHLPATFDDVELSPYRHDRALVPEPVGHGPGERRYRADPPRPVPRERAEKVLAPAPQPPAEPVAQPVAEPVAQPVAEPVAQPVAEPVAEPVVQPDPVTGPDCSDPSSPGGADEQAAWTAACGPVVVGQPAPAPSQGPTSEPTAAPTPAPSAGSTIGTAGDWPRHPGDRDGPGDTSTAPAAPADRRPRPTRSPTTTPDPAPEPAPQQADDAAAGAPTARRPAAGSTDPSASAPPQPSSLPSTQGAG